MGTPSPRMLGRQPSAPLNRLQDPWSVFPCQRSHSCLSSKVGEIWDACPPTTHGTHPPTHPHTQLPRQDPAHSHNCPTVPARRSDEQRRSHMHHGTLRPQASLLAPIPSGRRPRSFGARYPNPWGPSQTDSSPGTQEQSLPPKGTHRSSWAGWMYPDERMLRDKMLGSIRDSSVSGVFRMRPMEKVTGPCHSQAGRGRGTR